MSEGSGRSPAARAGRHRWIPFWVLQASEVAIALVFMELLIHVSNGGLLVAAAVTFFALAVTARGPLGIFRICGQRLHLTLATAAAAAQRTRRPARGACGHHASSAACPRRSGGD